MRLGLTASQERFRRELRELFAEDATRAELRRLAAAGGEPDPRPLYRRLGERRLLAPNWPVGYGGRGATPLEAALVVEELVRHGVPETLHTLSVQIVGNFVLMAGTEAQKDALLAPLAAGEAFATVLYTEPEAGSDLAALATEARQDGDGWVLRGRKVYSLKAHLAQYGLCAARTARDGPRYRGLTLFMVPLDADGVRVGTLESIGDEQFADVTLEGVRVGADAVVGAVGGAWPLITEALALERTGVEYHAKAARWLRAQVERAAAAGQADDALLEEVGRLGAQVEASRLLAWRTLTQLADGRVDPVAAAASKWYASETARRVAWWAAEADGLAGGVAADDPEPVLGGLAEAAYREAPGLTISAGTSEMLLQTIAAGLAAGEGWP